MRLGGAFRINLEEMTIEKVMSHSEFLLSARLAPIPKPQSKAVTAVAILKSLFK